MDKKDNPAEAYEADEAAGSTEDLPHILSGLVRATGEAKETESLSGDSKCSSPRASSVAAKKLNDRGNNGSVHSAVGTEYGSQSTQWKPIEANLNHTVFLRAEAIPEKEMKASLKMGGMVFGKIACQILYALLRVSLSFEVAYDQNKKGFLGSCKFYVPL